MLSILWVGRWKHFKLNKTQHTQRNKHFLFCWSWCKLNSEPPSKFSSSLSRRQYQKHFYKRFWFMLVLHWILSDFSTLPYPNMMQIMDSLKVNAVLSSPAAVSAVKLICCLYMRLILNKSASCCVLKYELNWQCIFHMTYIFNLCTEIGSKWLWHKALDVFKAEYT